MNNVKEGLMKLAAFFAIVFYITAAIGGFVYSLKADGWYIPFSVIVLVIMGIPSLKKCINLLMD